MTRKEAIAGQLSLQELSIEQIKGLKAMAPAELNDEVRYVQQKLTDSLFLQNGIELDDLQTSTAALKLEEDEEYMKIMDEYNEKIELLYKQ